MPASRTHESRLLTTRKLNHGEQASRTRSTCESRIPLMARRAPARQWAASDGVSPISAFARIFATTTSNSTPGASCAGESTSSIPWTRFRAALARVAASACGSMSTPAAVAASAPECRHRQNAGTATKIEYGFAAQILPREPFQAHRGSCMGARSEGESRLQFDHDTARIRETRARRDTPKVFRRNTVAPGFAASLRSSRARSVRRTPVMSAGPCPAASCRAALIRSWGCAAERAP